MTSPLVWAVLLSAATVSLAQPNDWMAAGSPLLALVGWVPLFWALRRSVSNQAAMGLGGLFCLATTLLQHYWLAFYQDSGFWTMAGVTAGLALYGTLLGPVVRVLLLRPGAARPFLVGAAWAVFEFLKSNGFFGFPWGLAAYPLHSWPWIIQIADLTGLSFLSFLVISWNAWLAEALEPDGSFQRGSGLFFAILVVGLAAYGLVRLQEPRPSRGTVQLALIQQNGDPWDSGDDLGPLATSVAESRRALENAKIDLVVWSETALRHPLQEWRPYYERNPAEDPLFRAVRASRSWWLFGNPYFQSFDYAKGLKASVVNGAVLMDPQARIDNYYGKIQQSPFTEAIPFWEVPLVRSFFQSALGVSGSWDRGRLWTVFEIPVRGSARELRFGAPIGFEDAFPWLNSTLVQEGAEVLINLSNDSWSQRDSSQRQHHVAALFRSVENRVWVVRSSNSGVTSVIDPTGRVAAGPLPSFQPGHLVFGLPLPVHRTLTPYTELGDWPVGVFAVWLVWSLAGRAGRKR